MDFSELDDYNQAVEEARKPSPTSTPQTDILYSVGVKDGHVFNFGYLTDSAWEFTGDWEGATMHSAFKAIVSFNLGSIPAGAVITSATLKVYQTSIGIVTNPFAFFGGVKVDHISFDTFDSTLYNSTPLRTFTSYLASTSLEGYRTLNVTTAVQDDLAQNKGYS